ncbi:hypothetical protein K458DRAFT_185967 [Lentithecium fluviatile CBS 122367]|uniref:Uncharacterized protein n=1 Tax=Lentithecium fluviatile CBS 122367 TaxID=1168545 RepID=A0A6G1J9A8_9PLEO|nr:hypothetical protein K458DRAFT_185967 [Lentithecium fluviatile CBS 122367]
MRSKLRREVCFIAITDVECCSGSTALLYRSRAPQRITEASTAVIFTSHGYVSLVAVGAVRQKCVVPKIRGGLRVTMVQHQRL